MQLPLTTMPPASSTLQESVAKQREVLANMLREPLALAAQACSRAWPSRAGLNAALTHALTTMPACKYLYALDTRAIQLSDNISRVGLVETDYGRDRSDRPYMREAVPNQGFLLTQAYISLRAKRTFATCRSPPSCMRSPPTGGRSRATRRYAARCSTRPAATARWTSTSTPCWG
jgi:hypothetical protein